MAEQDEINEPNNAPPKPKKRGRDARRVRLVEPTQSAKERRPKLRLPEQTETGIQAARRFVEETEKDIDELKFSNTPTSDLERACLIVDEALQHHEKLGVRLKTLNDEKGMTFHTWGVERRLCRQNSHSTEEFTTFLKESIPKFQQPHEKNLLCLTLMRRLWTDGMELSQLRQLYDTLLQDAPCTSPLAKLLSLLLDVDAHLEGGEIERAARCFHEIADDDRFPAALQTAAKVSVGFLYATHGLAEQAIYIFKSLNEVGALPAYAFETLAYLAAYQGEDQILEQLSEQFVVDVGATREMHPSSMTLIASHARTNEDALALIEGVLRHAPKDVYAIERAVEWAYNLAQGKIREGEVPPTPEESVRQQKYATDAVINALNARLDTDLSKSARIATLCRLGHAYESQPQEGYERAAAEVYREALELDPTYTPALRALGRIFARRENWTSLCQLYETEIVETKGGAGTWRRHFQAAQIYETKLNVRENALYHYRAVLQAKPGYLPALKGASRILEIQENWGELCDLFLLSTSITAVPDRQKLYLLDKVAKIADEKLNNVDVAIAAWEEILHLSPDHPSAYTSLGRLLAGSEKWEKLLQLNEQELKLMEDPEEMVVMMVKNATLCEEKCHDLDAAERWYAEALRLIPDFMPALEGLGRIYVQSGRWSEVIEMTDAQLSNTEDLGERIRQLSALAEIYDLRLGSREDAERIYRKLLKLAPKDPIALDALIRYGYDSHDYDLVVWCREVLYKNTGDGASPYIDSEVEFMDTDYDLAELDEMDTCEIEASRIRSTLLFQDTDEIIDDDLTPTTPKITAERRTTSNYRVASSNAYMYEFMAKDYKTALHFWKNALELAPDDAHALDGYVRMAAAVRVPTREQILFLESLIGRPCNSDGQNRIYLALARLLESQQRAAQAGRSYRAKSTQSLIESDFAIRFAMAAEGERRSLDLARQEAPISGLDSLASTLLELENDKSRDALKVALSVVDHAERNTLLSMCDPRLANEFIHPSDSPELRFASDVYNVVEGRTLRMDANSASQLRLRSIHAKQSGNKNKYLQALEGELPNLLGEDLVVSRLVEGAEFIRLEDPEHSKRLILRAVDRAFPQVIGLQTVADSPILDRVHQGLFDGGYWEVLKYALMSHLNFDNLDHHRRIGLMKLLATTFEERGNELDAAQFLWSAIATFEASQEVLESLGRVAAKHGDLETAIQAESQRLQQEPDQNNIVTIALLLASLYDQNGQREVGIEMLERVLVQLGDPYAKTLIMRATAKLYMEQGDHKRAVDLLETILPEVATENNLEDYRLLVSLYADKLDKPKYAYDIQRQIVEALPNDSAEIDDLIELAWEIGEIDYVAECCHHLVDIARTLEVEGRHEEFVNVLKRVAIAYDEDLKWPDQAALLYRELLDLVQPQERIVFERRLAFALSEVQGCEREAHEVFQMLASKEPYDPTIYRGLLELYPRCKAYDRTRVAAQTLLALGCKVEIDQKKTKTIPSRELAAETIKSLLLENCFPDGLLQILRCARGIYERKWSDRIPDCKRLGGDRLREGVVYERVADAMSLFGIRRFKLLVGDVILPRPEVFSDGGPTVWVSRHLIEEASEAEIRFLAGWSAAMAWSELASMLHVDSIDLYHLIEAARLAQTGSGFSSTVSPKTQELLDAVSSTLVVRGRRRLNLLLDEHLEDFMQLPPGFWGEAMESVAARVGLLMAGEVDAAMRQVRKFRSHSPDLSSPHARRNALKDNVATGLLRFAMSNQYLGLRYASGLSGPPSEI